MDPFDGISDDPVRFDAAIKALRDRAPMTKREWELLEESEREFAFTVADVAQADVIADVMDAIERAVRDGRTFDDFKDDVGDALEASWGGEDPGRLEMIFRTNVQTAYGQGRYREMTAPSVADARPYWRFDGILDSHTSEEICEPIIAAKVVLPADSEWWDGHYPPLHPQCRSIVTPLSEEEAREEGITSSPPKVHAVTGFGARPSVRGTDWQPSPEDYPGPLGEALEDKLAS